MNQLLQTEYLSPLPGVEINIINHRVIAGERIIDLRSIEFRILYFLLKNKNVFCPAEEIYKAAFGSDAHLSNSMQVQICNLRQKLKNILEIETRRGLGYRLNLIGRTI